MPKNTIHAFYIARGTAPWVSVEQDPSEINKERTQFELANLATLIVTSLKTMVGDLAGEVTLQRGLSVDPDTNLYSGLLTLQLRQSVEMEDDLFFYDFSMSDQESAIDPEVIAWLESTPKVVESIVTNMPLVNIARVDLVTSGDFSYSLYRLKSADVSAALPSNPETITL